MQRSCLSKALCVAVGAIGLSTAVASANTVLFTTGSDWTGWSGSSGRTSAAVSTSSFDNNTTNGAGNNPGNAGSSINAGGSDVNGSLQITPTGPLGFGILASGPGEAYSPSFMAAIDPGSTAAYQPPNFTSGTTVAYSGNLRISYTMPDLSASSNPYFQVGVLLAYNGDNGYATFFADNSTTSSVINGQTVYTANVPYNIVAGDLSYFSFSIMSNASGDVTPGAFTLDDVEVVNSNNTPEPASVALLGIGGLALLKRRRA